MKSQHPNQTQSAHHSNRHIIIKTNFRSPFVLLSPVLVDHSSINLRRRIFSFIFWPSNFRASPAKRHSTRLFRPPLWLWAKGSLWSGWRPETRLISTIFLLFRRRHSTWRTTSPADPSGRTCARSCRSTRCYHRLRRCFLTCLRGRSCSESETQRTGRIRRRRWSVSMSWKRMWPDPDQSTAISVELLVSWLANRWPILFP